VAAVRKGWLVDHINGVVVFPGGCPEDCAGCARMRHLLTLAGRLRAQGLDVHVGTRDPATTGRHLDAVRITNPCEPHRGSFHVDGEGCATWDLPPAGLDEHVIGALADEISNVLRVNGLPRRLRPRHP
jgi:hypothetical protein